jgi:hypothetical protein
MTPTKTPISSDEESACLFFDYVGAIHRQVVRELQEIEDRKVFGTLEQATRALLDERALKDWTGRLRKGVLLTWLPFILLVSSPIALALIWAVS